MTTYLLSMAGAIVLAGAGIRLDLHPYVRATVLTGAAALFTAGLVTVIREGI